MEQYTFRSNVRSAVIDGCKFTGHEFRTTDEKKAERLRESSFCGRMFYEIEPEPKERETIVPTDYKARVQYARNHGMKTRGFPSREEVDAFIAEMEQGGKS